jgi:hypothetical protein
MSPFIMLTPRKAKWQQYDAYSCGLSHAEGVGHSADDRECEDGEDRQAVDVGEFLVAPAELLDEVRGHDVGDRADDRHAGAEPIMTAAMGRQFTRNSPR